MQDEFAELWHRHHRQVHGYALRRTDPAAAQDVVSETFLVAWRRRTEMPPTELPWLLGVARHVLANHARGARRQAALAQVLISQAETHAGRSEVDTGLMHALAALEDGDREVLLLSAWDGLTSVEAALSLGCSPTAFRVRLLRARRRLRVVLAAAQAPVSATPERSTA